MGISLMSSSGGSRYETNPADPNPNVYDIVRIGHINGNIIAKINYPNCTNYEGDKILVWLNRSPSEIHDAIIIDPHFTNEYLSPVARFEPTDRGWELAIAMCSKQ